MRDSRQEAWRAPGPLRVQRLRAALKRAIRLATPAGRRRRRRVSGRAAVAAASRPGGFDAHWERIITRLLKFGGASTGNRVELFCDGDQLLENLWAAIENAKHQIWFEMYTLEPDRVGCRTIAALVRAAQRGCEVLVLFDAVGSSHLTEDVLAPLRQAGARVEIFNPWLRWPRRGPLLRRDHRKIIIIDGRIGYCGGMNVSEDYAGHTYGKCTFRDCHMRLEGPGVRNLAAVFASSWRLLAKELQTLPKRSPPIGETFLQVQASSGWQGRRAIQRALRLTARYALLHCYVTTPYFIPAQRMIRALNRAADRGVDVRILTAGISDVPVVALAARHIYGRLLKHGVRIFEMVDTTLHAKTITIDGVYSTVGSFNLDTWSDKRNLEVNIAMVDPSVAAQMQRDFAVNLENAREITLDTWARRSWWKRWLHWAAYQVLRL